MDEFIQKGVFFMRCRILFFLLIFFFLKTLAFAEAQRILPMAPNLVEVVFSLGAGDRVIAIPDYSFWPPEAMGLPSVGGYFNPNLERITALKPDLVLLQGGHEKLELYCKGRGIPVLHLSMESIASIRDGILATGKALELEERAQLLVGEMEAGLEKIREKYQGKTRPKVLMVLGRTPGTLSQIMTAGKGSFLTELVALAGGENIFADHPSRYPMISKESILIGKPEVILEFMPEGMGKNPDFYLNDWKKFASLPAVQHGRVFLLTDRIFLVPGPRIAIAAEEMAKILWKEGP